MSKKIKSKQTYKFNKGEKTHLDYIYEVQGLAGGNWWKTVSGDDVDDDIIITDNIHFEIIVYETL